MKKTKQEKILEKALEITLLRIEKESCIYCPYGMQHKCKLTDDSEECLKKLKEEAIKIATKIIEGEK